VLLPIIFSGIGVTECKVPRMAVLFLTSLILNPARILVEAPRNGAGTSNEGEKDEFVSGN